MCSHYPPIILPRAEARILESSIVDDTYRLHIALPVGYDQSDERCPVVYAADGNESIFTLWHITKELATSQELPPLIIVGIGYPTDDPTEIFVKRARDYNPTPDAVHDRRYMEQFHLDAIETGGAENFLRFIREELKPFMHVNYRTLTDDNTYVGHSGGALFGLYTLFHQPDTFNRYVLGSPTIFRNNAAILHDEDHYAHNHDDLPAHVFLSVGAREEIDDPLIRMAGATPQDFKFVTYIKKLAKTLRDRHYPRLTLKMHVFDGETHLSVIQATYSRGLREVLATS